MNHCVYRPDVDGLRAIAVISVLLFHLDVTGFAGGFVGVDVFFVISGYLITRLIVNEIEQTGTFSFSNFYHRRIRRLAPALLAMLGVVFVIAFLLLSTDQFQRFGGASVHATVGLSNFYFWRESDYFDTSADLKPLLHTWSLGVEEQFYLIWPLVVVICLCKLHRFSLPAIIVLSGAFSLFLNFVFSDGNSSLLTALMPSVAEWFADGRSTIFYLMPFRVFEFGIGAIMVWLQGERLRFGAAHEIISLLGLSLIAYSVFTYDEEMLFPSVNALAPCVGAAMLIYSGANARLGKLISSKLAVGIGLISYSLYLVHWPIIVFYKYVSQNELSWLEQLGVAVASGVLAVMLYQFVERPFRYRRSAVVPSSGFALLLCMLFLPVIVASSSVWANKGWQWRLGELPAELQAILEDSKQFHRDQYGGVGYPYKGWLGGQAEQADLVLIGDSHARQYATGLQELIGEPHNKNIFISSVSCLVLPGVTRTTPGTDWDKLCPNALDTALDMVRKSPSAPVMIGESWDFQLRNAGIIDSVREFDGKLEAEKHTFLLSKLAELKQLLNGRELIVMGNVPGSVNGLPADCLTRPRYLFDPCENGMDFDPQQGLGFAENPRLSEFASRTDGVHFMNPYDVFCGDGRCRPMQAGKILFSDATHLSKDGSRVLVDHFKTSILAVLERQARVHQSTLSD